MSLSDRLKAAEYDRRLAAGLPVDHLPPAPPAEALVDVSQGGAPILDLTGPWPSDDVIPLASASGADDLLAGRDHGQLDGDLLDADVDLDGEHPVAPGRPQVGARSRIECEQCGGPCQIDLIDAVNQTVSLSCLSCFHMFRVEARI